MGHYGAIASAQRPELHLPQAENWQHRAALAVELIRRSEFLEPYIGSIQENKYREMLRALKPEGISTQKHGSLPDYPAFIAYASYLIVDIANRKPDVKKVTFNISRKQYAENYIRTDLREQLVAFLDARNTQLADLVGDIVPLSMDLHMPLQAADVLCWYVQRAYSGIISKEKTRKIWKFSKKKSFVDTR